jgi:uncharacterized protein (TIGR02594 family)
MTALVIQRRLKAHGYDPGPLDGVPGRLTIRAIKAFQRTHGLVADGIVGPQTAAAMFGEGAARLPARDGGGNFPAPWFDEALRLKGTREAAGGADNHVILRWAARLGLAYAHDSVAWCGLFVAHCIGATLPDEPLPNNPLGARNWLRFGREIAPVQGAVLVFWRGSPSSWTGHVGFHASEDGQAFHVLGGNQADAVTIARVERTRLLGARWPRSAPLRVGPKPNLRADTDTLSTSEA